jgi:CRISPR-associated protein Csy1
MLQLLHDLTPPMIPHYATDPDAVVHQFILASKSLSTSQIELAEPIEDMTSDWTPWANIFCLVAPELYGNAISAFEQLAFNIWPKLNFTAPHVCKATNSPRSLQKKIRIGFVVHDAMPMMSGLLSHLDKRIFETVFLRPGKAGKSPAAKNWVARADRTVEYSDVNTYSAIQTIANEELDIIVSCPYMAAIFYPMMARLAPLQIVLLEPNWTDGLTNADYYISWQQAEPANPGDYYKSAVSFLQHPPYWIERPLLDINLPISEDARSDIRRRVLGLGPESRIYLCANTPPKIHPAMDDIFYDLLERDQTGFLVLLRSEFPPVRTLKIRLREKLGKYYDRIIFLPTLSKEDAHLLLQSVDCCLDSYPLCGMSSSFDGAMLGVPIVTLPCDIPFGRWTAAIYEYIGVSGLTAKDREDYIDIATRLASDKIWRHQLSIEIKEKSSCYVESKASCEEFQDFIIRSWERRTSGLPPSNWLSGRWQ